jgi:hypothetical protein
MRRAGQPGLNSNLPAISGLLGAEVHVGVHTARPRPKPALQNPVRIPRPGRSSAPALPPPPGALSPRWMRAAARLRPRNQAVSAWLHGSEWARLARACELPDAERRLRARAARPARGRGADPRQRRARTDPRRGDPVPEPPRVHRRPHRPPAQPVRPQRRRDDRAHAPGNRRTGQERGEIVTHQS